jgi:NADPH:quinone reductase-like Zn-dependent oxidoreductase
MASLQELPQRTRQWLTEQDGLDKLRLDEVECPKPGVDEVLVEVRAVSLNYRDTEGTLTLLVSLSSPQ